jgi:hypothetical protein
MEEASAKAKNLKAAIKPKENPPTNSNNPNGHYVQ